MKLISITLLLAVTIGLTALPGVTHDVFVGSASGGIQTPSVIVRELSGATSMIETGTSASPLQTPSLVASFLYSAGSAKTQEDIWLDASASQGSIVEYQWDLDGDGVFETSATSASQVATYVLSGDYTLQLRVLDDAGNLAVSEAVPIAVLNRSPIADFTVDSQASDSVELSPLDNSSDADGSIVAWSWDFGDGTTSDESNPTYLYLEAGSYTISLQVTDNEGAVSTPAETSIHVANTSPVAAFSVQDGPLQAGEVVRFVDDSADLSASGGIVHVAWDFGDESYYAAGPRADGVYSHVYENPGPYYVTLYVIDNCGALSRARALVVIH